MRSFNRDESIGNLSDMTTNSIKKSQLQNRQLSRRIRGQGMTEYIIIVALIAISAIAAVGFFGDVVREQFVGMAQLLGGGEKTTSEAVAGAVKSAGEESGKTNTLDSFGE